MALTERQRAEGAAIRAALDQTVPHIADSPAAINDAVALIRDWKPGSYAPGDVRQYQGIPYKCILTHDSGPNPNWTPDATPNLWMQYHGTSPETARPYKQPLMAEDAYQVDEYCIDGGVTYRCKVAATVYPPSALPGSWEAVGGSGSGDTGGEQPTDPTEPGGDEPTPELGTLANPIPYPTDGSVFAVANGNYYSYKGKVYLAKLDMPSCTWSPDTAGLWQWELVG